MRRTDSLSASPELDVGRYQTRVTTISSALCDLLLSRKPRFVTKSISQQLGLLCSTNTHSTCCVKWRVVTMKRSRPGFSLVVMNSRCAEVDFCFSYIIIEAPRPSPTSEPVSESYRSGEIRRGNSGCINRMCSVAVRNRPLR